MSTAWDAQPDSAHEDWDALAVGYALSALEPGELERFTPHVHGCERCRRTVDETEAVGAALGTIAPAAEPSFDLRSRVLAAAEQARPAASGRPVFADRSAFGPSMPMRPAASSRWVDAVRRPNTSRPANTGPGRHAASDSPAAVSSLSAARSRRASLRRTAPWLVSAAAAVVAAVLAVTVIGLSGSRNNARTTADVQQRIISSITNNGPAQIVPLKSDNKQIATVVTHAGDISVVASAVPENNKSNSIYVLWGMTSKNDATPKALGTFDVSTKSISSAKVVNDLSGNYSSLKTFAISQEKGRTAPVLPTKVLAIGSA